MFDSTVLACQTAVASLGFKWCVTDPLRTVVFTRIWLWLHKVSAEGELADFGCVHVVADQSVSQSNLNDGGAAANRRRRALLRAVRFVSTAGVPATHAEYTNRWQSAVHIIASVEYVQNSSFARPSDSPRAL